MSVAAIQHAINILPLRHRSMALQTENQMRKRQSDSQRAIRQQRDRRKESLFKKAYEYSLECDADVYVGIRIKKNGQIFAFNSGLTRQWPLSKAQMVSLLVVEVLSETLIEIRTTIIRSQPE